MTRESDSPIIEDVLRFFSGGLRDVPAAPDPMMETPLNVVPDSTEVEVSTEEYFMATFLNGLFPIIPDQPQRDMVSRLKVNFPKWKAQSVKDITGGNNPNRSDIAKILQRLTLQDITKFAQRRKNKLIAAHENALYELEGPQKEEHINSTQSGLNYWAKMEEITRYAADEEERGY